MQAGRLDILNGGEITTDSWGQGNSGSVNIKVNGTLTVNGQGNSGFTGIDSGAEQGSTNHAGVVTVQAGSLDIMNGGQITTSTGPMATRVWSISLCTAP